MSDPGYSQMGDDGTLDADDQARLDNAEVAQDCVLSSDGERLLLTINEHDFSLSVQQTADLCEALERALVWESVSTQYDDERKGQS